MQLDIARCAEDRMQKEQDRLQMIVDDAIMEKDISHMSVEQQHYYQLRNHAIMAKAIKNASTSNFNVLPDYYLFIFNVISIFVYLLKMKYSNSLCTFNSKK